MGIILYKLTNDVRAFGVGLFLDWAIIGWIAAMRSS